MPLEPLAIDLHPRSIAHLLYLVPSRTITYYSGRTVRYFWGLWRSTGI